MEEQYSDEEGMLIGELARKANVSVRTIRYYIAEGLLAAPQARGRFATYNEDALLRLQVIRQLKDAFLPLREIRERLAGLSIAEVRDLAGELEKKPAPAQPSRSLALDYIDRLTAQKDAPGQKTAAIPVRYQTPPVIKPAPQPRQRNQPEHWRHYRVAPGIVLLAGDPLDEASEKKLNELIQFANRLFSTHEVKNV